MHRGAQHLHRLQQNLVDVLVHVCFGGFGRDQRENEQIHCFKNTHALVSNAKLKSIFLQLYVTIANLNASFNAFNNVTPYGVDFSLKVLKEICIILNEEYDNFVLNKNYDFNHDLK